MSKSTLYHLRGALALLRTASLYGGSSSGQGLHEVGTLLNLFRQISTLSPVPHTAWLGRWKTQIYYLSTLINLCFLFVTRIPTYHMRPYHLRTPQLTSVSFARIVCSRYSL